jgi:hypothetical protein
MRVSNGGYIHQTINGQAPDPFFVIFEFTNNSQGELRYGTKHQGPRIAPRRNFSNLSAFHGEIGIRRYLDVTVGGSRRASIFRNFDIDVKFHAISKHVHWERVMRQRVKRQLDHNLGACSLHCNRQTQPSRWELYSVQFVVPQAEVVSSIEDTALSIADAVINST